MSDPPAPAAPATVQQTPTPSAASPVISNTPLTPSETLNEIAHAPARAINKAQEVIALRRDSGQARIDAATIGEDLPDTAPEPQSTAPVNRPSIPSETTTRATTTTSVSPGVAATAQVDAMTAASAEFRSFVANAKVTGVFQGPPARVMINNRLTRVGEVIDATLGVTFDGVDSKRRHLLFKDRSGATVSRRF